MGNRSTPKSKGKRERLRQQKQKARNMIDKRQSQLLSCEMERFDFEKPIDAVVVFEDSDESTLSSDEVLITAKNEQYSNSPTDTVPKREYFVEFVGTASSSSSSVITNESGQDSDVDNDILDKKTSIKRKIPDEHSNDSVPITVELPKLNKRKKQSASKGINSKNHLLDNQYDLSKIKTNNKCTNNLPKKSKNFAEYLDKYSELISCVCEYLVAIVKETQYLKTKTDWKLAGSYINKITTFYFGLSYTVVIIIFIPRKNDVEFKNHVINTILEIAKKQDIKCEYNIGEQIYLDLLKWAELHKQKLNMNINFSQITDDDGSIDNNPEANELSTSTGYDIQNMGNLLPASTNMTKNNNNIAKHKSQKARTNNTNCSGNPRIPAQNTVHAPYSYAQQTTNSLMQNQSYNNQVRINVCTSSQAGQSRLPYSNQIPLRNTNVINPYLHFNPATFTPNVTCNFQTREDFSNRSDHFRPQPHPSQPAFRSNNLLQTQTNNRQQKGDFRTSEKGNILQMPFPVQNSRTNEHAQFLKSNQHVNSPLQPILNSLISKKQPNPYQQTIDCYASNQSFNTPPNYNVYYTNGINNAPLQEQSTHQLQEERPDLIALLNCDNANCTEAGQNNSYTQQDINIDRLQDVRKSLSRDSGFMSPLNLNIDELFNTVQETAKAAELMPVITNVTSLNPSAARNDPGKCLVCKAVTTSKCSNCYENYYCSNLCQIRDKHDRQICAGLVSIKNNINK